MTAADVAKRTHWQFVLHLRACQRCTAHRLCRLGEALERDADAAGERARLAGRAG